jgi:WD40 repeat protein
MVGVHACACRDAWGRNWVNTFTHLFFFHAETARRPPVPPSDTWFKLKGHTDAVQSIAFSHLWIIGPYRPDLEYDDGRGRAKLEDHTSPVLSVAFSQDGSRVVPGSSDKTVRIWNATMGEVEAELEGHTGEVRSIAFSQDSS